MGVLAIIPARGGSRGIPRKNLRKLNGVPMITYTIRAALQARLVERTVVSTDDDEIAQVAKQAGAEVPFLRPAELATDDATLDGVVDHVLTTLKARDGYEPSAHVILQPTNPMRTGQHIDEAIQLLNERHAASVIAVSEPAEHPAEMARFEDGAISFPYAPSPFDSGTQRQGYEPCLFINGAIYLTDTTAYREQGKRLAIPVVPYMIDRLDGIDIDSEEQLLVAELLMQHRLTRG